MTNTKRIFVELLAPPFLAALWVTIFSSHDSVTFSDFLIGTPALIMFSYMFGIIPAGVYTLAMELWFRRGLRSRFGLLCTVGLSGVLGGLAGFCSAAIGSGLGFLIPSDCFHFLEIGAVVGLLIGFYVTRRQTAAA